VENVLLMDYNNNRLNIKVSIFVDEDGITTAILYPIAVLYNDTDYDLHLKDPDSRTGISMSVPPRKSISLSNNRLLVFKPYFPPTSGSSSK
jgi:hypothetical protein